MKALEFVQGFFVDFWHMPLVFKLFLLWMVGAGVRQWWKAREWAEMVAASAAWPVHTARVVWAQVSDRKKQGRHGPYYWEGLLTYSYTVTGHELEVGEHRKRFGDEEEADAWACVLRDTSVEVRVDPDDPKRSLWQETAVITPPTGEAAILDGSRAAGVWGFREMASVAILCVAVAGVIVAAWIQFSCVIGMPVVTADGNTKAFFAMHAGAIACVILSNVIFPKGGRLRSRRWRVGSNNDSIAARVVKFIGVYDGVVFVYALVREAGSLEPHAGKAQVWIVLMFSAGWLFFYAGAALGCWQYLNLRAALAKDR